MFNQPHILHICQYFACVYIICAYAQHSTAPPPPSSSLLRSFLLEAVRSQAVTLQAKMIIFDMIIIQYEFYDYIIWLYDYIIFLILHLHIPRSLQIQIEAAVFFRWTSSCPSTDLVYLHSLCFSFRAILTSNSSIFLYISTLKRTDFLPN